MGKSVPKGLKSKAEFLLTEFPEQFGLDFDENKRVFNDLKIPLSKVNRNILIGFITRQKKKRAS